MKNILISIKMILCMTVLTGVVYPMMITSVSQKLFSYKANGSLIERNGKIIGSELIAQEFKSDRYFWPRPSAIAYNPMSSGGSNLALSSKVFKEEVSKREDTMKSAHGSSTNPPEHLLSASASGLDPHISKEAALYQISRVARSRHFDDITTKKLIAIIDQNTEKPTLAYLGEERVNVLKLNLALEELK